MSSPLMNGPVSSLVALAAFSSLAGGCDGATTARGQPDAGSPAANLDAATPRADAGIQDSDAGVADDILADRPYQLFVPSTSDPATPAPLLLVLHGYGASGAIQTAYFGILDVAEEEGLLVAYPDGLQNDAGQRFWNATDACCNFEDDDVDDVAYLTAVIDDVVANHDIDPARIYVAGHSNGGFMAHRLACERADRIAAIVSLAGATFDDESVCQPSESVAVLQIHGDQDSTILYDGGALGEHAYPSAVTTVERWAALNQCDGELEDTGRQLNLDSFVLGRESRVERFRDCPGPEADVELWTMEGSGHIPGLRKPEWPEAIVEFLLAHPKPASGTGSWLSSLGRRQGS